MAKKQRRKSESAPKPKVERNAPITKHAGWVALAVILLSLVAFFYPVFFQGQGFQPPDNIASMSHKPFLEEAFDGEGSFLERYPLWNPYVFSGMPSFGSLTAAPYTNPMSFVLSWLSGVFKVLSYYFLLGMFMWLLLRRKGLGQIPSTYGALAFIFCAHVLTLIMIGHNSKIATLVFLPLILLAADEIFEKPRILWWAVLALGVGTMIVTSHLQIAYYTLLAAGLLFLVMTIGALKNRMSPVGILGRWASFGTAVGIGYLASSVITIAVREYADFSIRGGTGGGLPYDYATSWSLHPGEISTFFIPSFFGFGGASYWGWMPFTDNPVYMGILPVFLAVFAFVCRPKDKYNIFLIILGLFALVVSFGKHLPILYNFMFDFVPYFNKFRVPVMITLLLHFSVAVGAAIGLDRLLRNAADQEKVNRRNLMIAGGAMTAILVLLGGMMMSGSLDGTISARAIERAQASDPRAAQATVAQLQNYGNGIATEVRNLAKTDFARVLVIFLAGFGLLVASMRRMIPSWVAGSLLVVLTLIDLGVVGNKVADYQSRKSDPTLFAATPAVQFLQSDPGPYRILSLTQQGSTNWYAYFKIPNILGYHPAKLKIYQDLIDEKGVAGVRKSLSQRNFNIIDMLGAKYIVADERTAAAVMQLDNTRFEMVHRDGTEAVLQNHGVMPRLWFASSYRVIPDNQAHLAAVANPSWDPAAEALLFEDVGSVDPPTGATASVTEYSQRRISATVNSPGRCLLMMSEVFLDAGWTATLNGAPVEIHRGNYALRSIVVPPGTHELVMEFNPDSFQRGATISIAAYAVMLLALGVGIVRSRRGSGSGSESQPVASEA